MRHVHTRRHSISRHHLHCQPHSPSFTPTHVPVPTPSPSPFPFFNQSAMAQGEKKEETELHVPAKSLTLCVNNCGFAGNPATNNMCQSCFQSSGISLPPRSCSPRSTVGPILTPVQATWASEGAEDHEVEKPAATAAQTALAQGRLVNRCFACRKRVDLTGFRCRCGKLFCAEHRYSDRHDCSFDYKAAGRAAIALENPVVRPAKIVRL